MGPRPLVPQAASQGQCGCLHLGLSIGIMISNTCDLQMLQFMLVVMFSEERMKIQGLVQCFPAVLGGNSYTLPMLDTVYSMLLVDHSQRSPLQ